MGEISGESKLKINRREFLNLAWLASLGILMVDIGGVIYLFALPRFREGEFGGQFVLGSAREVLPPPGSGPLNMGQGRFWLSRTETGLVLALYKVCTHLGCLYGWLDEAGIFRCPCHGSQFELDGTYISGPAPRSLDRFVVGVIDENGEAIAATDSQGNPLALPSEDLQLVIETGQLIRGKPKGIEYPIS